MTLTALLLHWVSTDAAVVALVMARMAGFVISLPGIGSGFSCWSLRVVMAALLTLLVAPVCVEVAASPDAASMTMLISLVAEAIVGALLGLSIGLLLAGVQVAGQLASQISGTSLAAVISGEGMVGGPPLARLFRLLCVAFFFALGGHRQLLSGLLVSFQDNPVGTVDLSSFSATAMLTLLTRSFATGLEIAAPVIAALLAATLLVAMLGRLIPHMDVWSATTAANGLALVAAIFTSVGVIGWTIESQLPDLVAHVFAISAGN